MNIEQLKYIAAVAKLGSITVASEKLHITQSAISQAVTNLEEELGTKIFNRSRYGAIPTDAGNLVIAKAMETLSKLEELKMAADTNHHMMAGKLRIGTIPSPLMYLPKTLAAYKKDYPNVQIEITEKASQDIADDIAADQLDIGLIGLSMEGKEMADENIEIEVVLRGKMIVAAGKQSPLAFTGTITPEEIINHPLVIYDDDRMWEFIDALSSKFGPADILFSTNNMDAIRNAIIENIAITIAPDYTIKNDACVKYGVIVPVDISHMEQDYPGMALIWPKMKHRTPIISNFISRLKADMADLKGK